MILLAPGSNLGSRARTLHRARQTLTAAGGVVAASRLCEPPAPPPAGAPGDWGRACLSRRLQLPTARVSAELPGRAKAIQAPLGRRPASRRLSCLIDIDIVAHADHAMADATRVLPRAPMRLRRSGLAPRCPITPPWRCRLPSGKAAAPWTGLAA